MRNTVQNTRLNYNEKSLTTKCIRNKIRKFPYHPSFSSKTAYAYIVGKLLMIAFISSIFQRQLYRPGFAYPVQHLEDEPSLHFQRPLLLHPLQKHLEGADDVDGVPMGTFRGAIYKKKMKIL